MNNIFFLKKNLFDMRNRILKETRENFFIETKIILRVRTWQLFLNKLLFEFKVIN